MDTQQTPPLSEIGMASTDTTPPISPQLANTGEEPDATRKQRLWQAVLRHGAAITIGIIIGIPVVLYGFFLLQGIFTEASDTVPRDVVIQDITRDSAAVLWTTDQESQGTILYGTEQTDMTTLAPNVTTSRDHEVVIENLEPGTTYYFTIQIAGQRYLNGGVPWFFTTEGESAGSGDGRPAGSGGLPGAGAQDCPQTTDCERIKELLGKGCSTADYLMCTRQ